MALFKCKMCGGDLNIENGATVCECEYCGTKQTLPKLDDEKRINLYERANHFRRSNEFDKAMGIYEMILSEDNTDAEAYWSIVLCRYGIEYVDDPAAHKKVPTVNRAQLISIYNDTDYQKAIANADGYQRDVYESEAKAIDEIQKGILEISDKEEPFDVFICYKETDNQGRRTHDSVYAQDIYNSLTREDYRVFFSRITLEDKIGAAYEPYIFAALNSAKVMLVVGTSSENMNAVWVKNEWSRYLAIVKKDNSKTLIPCYKDMSPYDMPEEFAFLQAQDMSKIGFMQDLIHGIQKVVSKNSFETTEKLSSSVNNSSTIASLLERTYIFLKEKNWEKAVQYTERILDIEPKNAEAYLCKVLVHFKATSFENLMKAAKDDHTIYNLDFNDYLNAVEFSNGKLSKDLKAFEQLRTEALYYHGCQQMQKRNYEKAIAYFESIRNYNDSSAKYDECIKNIDTIKNQNIKINDIDSKLEYLNSTLKKAEENKQRYLNLITSTPELIKSEKKELRKERLLFIISLSSCLMFIAGIGSMALCANIDCAENLQETLACCFYIFIILSNIMGFISWMIHLKRKDDISTSTVIPGLLFPVILGFIVPIKTIISISKSKKYIRNSKKYLKNLYNNCPEDDVPQIKKRIELYIEEKNKAQNIISNIKGNV